jgi:hypothetical protein
VRRECSHGLRRGGVDRYTRAIAGQGRRHAALSAKP